MIIGTAGHVDHGKTELIKALTGIDTDRLEEEKRRGISIVLGFAYIDLPKSGRVGIIDVPGHEKFLKNMLAGVGGVDIGMLVVAADESIMPQTVEHLEIMKLLGIKNMIAVISKKDLVDSETLEIVKEDVREFLKKNNLEDTKIIVISSKTGEGLGEVIKELDELCLKISPKQTSDIPRLFIDRVFEMKGFGLVITGTLVSGKIEEGDELWVYPQGLKTKIKQIQVHHEKRKEACAGERVALNLGGIKKEELKKGDVISKKGYMKPTKLVTISLQVLPSIKILKDWTRVRFYIGSAEILGRLSLIGKKEVKGGERVFAQLFLEKEAAAFTLDRFVLRNYSPLYLIGGGKILDISPEKIKKSDEILIPYLKAVDEGGIEEALLLKLVKKPQKEENLLPELGHSYEKVKKTLDTLKAKGEVITFNSYILSKKLFLNFKGYILSLISDFFKKYPLRAYMPKMELSGKFRQDKELFAALINHIEEVECVGDRVYLKGYKPLLKEEEKKKRVAIEKKFLESKLKPPEPEIDEVFRTLLEDGTIVKISEDIFLHKEVLNEAQNKIKNLIKERGAVTISEIREFLGTSRKYAVPLMEYLDRVGFTKRIGDKRVLKD